MCSESTVAYISLSLITVNFCLHCSLILCWITIRFASFFFIFFLFFSFSCDSHSTIFLLVGALCQLVLSYGSRRSYSVWFQARASIFIYCFLFSFSFFFLELILVYTVTVNVILCPIKNAVLYVCFFFFIGVVLAHGK